MSHQFILSTVGASLFTNLLSKPERDEWGQTLTISANLTDEELTPELSGKLDELEQRARQTLERNQAKDNRRISAELNGIYGIYQDQLAHGKGDMHWLIATDTAMGRRAADIVKAFMSNQGLTVDCFQPPRLSTADTQRFSDGVKSLIAWCEVNIPAYRDGGYKVIFNLVGSFKSLQGYLNTIGMFYADEIVYIFESPTSDLIRIPRLPITINIAQLQHRTAELAMMNEAYFFNAAEAKRWGLPESLLDDDGRSVTLSAWGQLIWNRSNLKADPGLQYDNYTGKSREGQPIGHFRLDQGRRASCVSNGGHLFLRHFGSHDCVNDNP